MSRHNARKEADLLLSKLRSSIPSQIDGKEAILQMKEEGSRNWRQMEWIGFWFEHFVRTEVTGRLGISVGPSFGRTQFDLLISCVWDLKVHPRSADGKLILNDKEAIDLCIAERGGFGFIAVVGEAEYDGTGEFKAWHDVLKGGTSAYEVERIKRGAPSRRRKVSFNPQSVEAVFFSDQNQINQGINEGWLTLFQSGMRNSNGNPRREKYQIDLDRAPSEIRVSSTEITQ
jgi:hypothetical protein